MQKKIFIKKCFIVFSVVYLIFAAIISFKINLLLNESNKNFGMRNSYVSTISDANFNKLNYRNIRILSLQDGKNNIKEKMFRTPIFTIHWFFGAKSIYWYTYEIKEDDYTIQGSDNVPVTIDTSIKNGHLYITKVYVRP